MTQYRIAHRPPPPKMFRQRTPREPWHSPGGGNGSLVETAAASHCIRVVIAVLAAAFLAFSSIEAEAQQPRAEWLHNQCRQDPAAKAETSASLEEVTIAGLSYWTCWGYLAGALDALALWSQTSAGPAICFPKQGISRDQARLIFLRFIEQNPQDLHRGAAGVIMAAMFSAFPCR